MEVDRNGLEVLDREECLRLLAGATLGRVGLTSGALPMVLPVNFLLDGERILVCTGRGSKMDAALRDAVVAFEVDDFDSMHHSGWSVAVTGVAGLLREPAGLKAVRQMPIARWAPQGEVAVVSISTEIVSGRRITVGANRDRRRPDRTGPPTHPERVQRSGPASAGWCLSDRRPAP